MNLERYHCGCPTESCEACAGEGYWYPYEEHPLEYAPGEQKMCFDCDGTGRWVNHQCGWDEM